MTRLSDAPRPLPHLDEPMLQRVWSTTELVVGQVIAVGERDYQLLGFDPRGVRPRRVYLQALASGQQHAMVVRDDPA